MEDVPATDHHVRADPARIQQVFWNVLRNACKFAGSEGAIVVRSENRSSGAITFTIADTGPGVAPENQEKIFDAFGRIGKHSEGLGLGLAISPAVLQAHDGSIRVESEGIGKGATFVIELPVTVLPAGRDWLPAIASCHPERSVFVRRPGKSSFCTPR